MKEPYNGYANYPTWNLALWLSNEIGTYVFYMERARILIEKYDKTEAKYLLADEIKDYIEENQPEINASTYSDLLNYAISEIDFVEVAEVFIEA